MTNTPDKSEMKALREFSIAERAEAFADRLDCGTLAGHEAALIGLLREIASSRPPADQVPDMVEVVAAIICAYKPLGMPQLLPPGSHEAGLKRAAATLAALQAVAAASEVGEIKTADQLKAVIEKWLFADDPSHWGRFEKALDAALKAVPAASGEVGEDLGDCELCGKPLALGQFVNHYDDIGSAHADCERPFAKPSEPTPAPADDGSTMPTFVLLGDLEELK